jgi:transcriptional regulator with XRE-family HTH domain
MGRSPRDSDEFQSSPAFAEALGRTIKVVRTDRGIHRRELAEAAGISYSYLTEIENGNKPPSSSVLEPIARALGLRMSELIQAAENRRDVAELTQDRSAEQGARSPMSAAPSLEELRSTNEQLDARFLAIPERYHAMRPSYRGANRNLRAALLELEQLLPSLLPEDVERLLDYARRLAR